MSEELIAHMRDRIQRVRKVIQLAHEPEMIAMLETMVKEAEADVARLEAEASAPVMHIPGTHN